jgi:hypothetical protein
MSAATTNTTVPARSNRSATPSRSKLLRVHIVLLLTFAIFVWVALTLLVAVRKGEHRRATFNSSGQFDR